jgi:hypothetical protein
MYESRPAAPAPEWTAEERGLIERVKAAPPQAASFFLNPWSEVAGPVRFHEAVLADIRHGPSRCTEARESLLERLRAYAAVIDRANEPDIV